MKRKILFASLALSVLISCNQGGNKQEAADSTAATVDSAAIPQKDSWAALPTEEKEKAIREKLAAEGSWTSADGASVYTFSADGNVKTTKSGQVGTASWKLSGDQLALKFEKTEETITVKVDGETLVLGDQVYSLKK